MMASQDDSSTESSDVPFLSTVEGEISFFRSIMRSRPVGVHRHFHVLSMRNSIFKDTGHEVPIEELWEKLRSCYELDALEVLELEGYDSTSSGAPTPPSIRSPSPSANLSAHPHFRAEYALPSDEFFNTLVSKRRVRSTASLSSNQSPPPPQKPRGKGRTKVEMAGLVGGDSDSSALTQESGDEGDAAPSSVATEADDEEKEEKDEDVEMRESPPVTSPTVTKSTRGRAPKVVKRVGPGPRTRATTSKATKKKKR